jgi:AbrB family looped-hinge helix DNA binding protein
MGARIRVHANQGRGSAVPKLTSKGQVTIPKWLRDNLGLKAGSQVFFDVDSGGRVVLRTGPRMRAEKPAAGTPKPEAKPLSDF